MVQKPETTGGDCEWKILSRWPLRIEAILLLLTFLVVALSGADASRLQNQGEKPSGVSYLDTGAQGAYFTAPAVTIALIILDCGLHFCGYLHPAWSVAITTVFACGWTAQAGIIFAGIDRPPQMSKTITTTICAFSALIAFTYGVYVIVSSVALHRLRQSYLKAEVSAVANHNSTSKTRKTKELHAWGPYRHAPIPIEVFNLVLAIGAMSLGIGSNFDYRDNNGYRTERQSEGNQKLPLAIVVPVVTILLASADIGLWVAGRLSPAYAVGISVLFLCIWVGQGVGSFFLCAAWSDFMDPSLLGTAIAFNFLPALCYLIYMSIAAAAVDRHRRMAKHTLSMAATNKPKLSSDSD